MTRLVAVDDDPYFLSLVQAAAQPLGLDVHTCGTSAAALQALEKPTDLLFVDGVLPDGSGEKLIERVLKRPGPRPRIAFVSAFFKDLRTFQRLRGLGAELVLHKPISVAQLRAELSELLAQPASPLSPPATSLPPLASKGSASSLPAIVDKLKELARDYAETLPDRCNELQQALTRARETGDASALGSLSHRLAGTAGSYGYLAISDAAAAVEAAVDAKVAFDQLASRAAELMAVLRRSAIGHEQLPSDLLSVRWLRQVLVVGTETSRETLVPVLAAQGIRVALACTQAELLDCVRGGSVDASIVMPAHASDDWIMPIAQHTARGCPILVLGDRGPLPLGGHPGALLPPDTTAEQLLSACRSFAAERFKGHSVLLVEDDPEIPRLVRTVLEPFGVTVCHARDLVECRGLTLDVAPTVALVDARLPVWSGFEVCRYLRADPRFEHMPILMLSSSTAPVNRLAAVEAGTSDYLLKPIVGVELAARVLERIRERERGLRDSSPAMRILR